MGFKDFLSAQLAKPSGFFGRLVMGWALDRGNARINAHTVDALDIKRGDDILDVGFGGGTGLARAATQVGEGQAVGVELSRPMVRRARRRFKSLIEQGRVAIHEGDACDLPFEDETFDRAYSVNTVYFWSEPTRALSEIHRVLKQGGRFVLALRSRAVLEGGSFSDDVFTFYTPEEARGLTESAGFQDVCVEHLDRNQKLDSVLVIGRRG